VCGDSVVFIKAVSISYSYFSPNVIGATKSSSMRFGEACGEWGSKERQTRLWWGNLKEENHLEA
jgi:hypothetical protein